MIATDFRVEDKLFSPGSTVSHTATYGFVTVLAVLPHAIVLGDKHTSVHRGIQWDNHVIQYSVEGPGLGQWRLLRYIPDTVVLPAGA